MTTTAVTSPDTGTMHDGSIQVPQHMTQLAAAGAREPTFVVKLHTILSNSDLSNIIAWLPHGRSWRIFDQTAFEKQVIPLYFQHGHFPSFTRQVSGWGFRRVLMGDDANSYHHKMFLRDQPNLCLTMRRLTTKHSRTKKKKEEAVDDYSARSRTFPLPESSRVTNNTETALLRTPPAIAATALINLPHLQVLSRTAVTALEQAGLENLAIEQILRNAALQQQQRRAAAEQALHQLAVMIQFSQHAPLNRTRSAPPPGTASRADDIATLAGLMSVQRASPLHNLPPFFQERLQRQTSRHENTATVNMMLQALIYGRTSQLGELSIPARPIAVSSQSHPTPSFASASSATAANITDQGQQRLLRILEEMNRSRVRRQAITQLFLQQRR